MIGASALLHLLEELLNPNILWLECEVEQEQSGINGIRYPDTTFKISGCAVICFHFHRKLLSLGFGVPCEDERADSFLIGLNTVNARISVQLQKSAPLRISAPPKAQNL